MYIKLMFHFIIRKTSIHMNKHRLYGLGWRSSTREYWSFYLIIFFWIKTEMIRVPNCPQLMLARSLAWPPWVSKELGKCGERWGQVFKGQRMGSRWDLQQITHPAFKAVISQAELTCLLQEYWKNGPKNYILFLL